ncbi:MAG: GNAT family N-acetyltransferase [Anaerolineae bacterium]
MQFAIREATARDLDALLPIIDEVDALHREHLPHVFQDPHGPPRDREYLLELLADESYGVFVAEAAGEVVGFVQVNIGETPPFAILVPRRVAAVENLAVREEFRRMGIGQALMSRAHQWAEELGASEIELTVYEFNHAAASFYHSLGYVPSSRRMSKRLG